MRFCLVDAGSAFCPVDVFLVDIPFHPGDVVFDATVPNNWIVSTPVVDLFNAIVGGFPNSFAGCHEALCLQPSEVRVLMLDPLLSDNFYKSTHVSAVVAMSRTNS